MPGLDRRTLALCSSVAVASCGCALVDLLDGPSVATVRFFATHAGTPGDDGYPFYGEEGTTRVFMTDTGWQVSLSEVYITTADVHFVRCQEQMGTPIEMFWGPCAESFISTDDLDAVPLGAVTVDDGQYCAIDVIYGPFIPPPDGDEHIAVPNAMIRDNTIVVVGVARRGEDPMLEEVPFEIVSDASTTARVDISKLEDDGPVVLDEENFPRDLTLIKSYDRFFDGIDFATATPGDIEQAILEGLEVGTRVHDGTYD